MTERNVEEGSGAVRRHGNEREKGVRAVSLSGRERRRRSADFESLLLTDKDESVLFTGKAGERSNW